MFVIHSQENLNKSTAVTRKEYYASFLVHWLVMKPTCGREKRSNLSFGQLKLEVCLVDVISFSLGSFYVSCKSFPKYFFSEEALTAFGSLILYGANDPKGSQWARCNDQQSIN